MQLQNSAHVLTTRNALPDTALSNCQSSQGGDLLNYQQRAIAQSIRIRGTVQGVGFRPTVYRIAKACGLQGEVWNDGDGVVITAVAPLDSIDRFLHTLQAECPPLAHIESIERQEYGGDRPLHHFDSFSIVESVTSQVKTAIAPDAATCSACAAELFDPQRRYFHYPFVNCTHCGPRLSIIRAIPYDRRNTSMAAFPMCPDCQQEYEDVENRRFHAQPVACPRCGPEIWLEPLGVDESDQNSKSKIQNSKLKGQTAINATCDLLKDGAIVAIKGIGGFHLACDATNPTAVQTLRQRKHRDHKPFALMARDIAIIEQYCTLNSEERALLQSPAAPIVLVKREERGKQGKKVECRMQNAECKSHSLTPSLPYSLAPGTPTLGFMLPYSPLHHLLLQQLDVPIVLTSGNRSDEPQCIGNADARSRLADIADYGLFHNRDIVNRVDDSVVRVVGDRSQVLRRARGFAPAPLRLPSGFEDSAPVLAMGSELKNTFCLVRQGEAILSQHLGDLEDGTVFAAYRDTLELYLHLFDHEPGTIALDRHPDYLSSKLGRDLAEANGLPIIPVQHHHAHVAACMAENGIPLGTEPVLGIALDGIGFGDDGTLWGGEFLLADYRGYQRLATLQPIAMLGGEQAIYQPWRNTYAHLLHTFGWTDLQSTYSDLDLVQFLNTKPHAVLQQMIATGLHSPRASSCGRLFDAIAAAIGICRARASYEGQGAIQLEALVTPKSLHHAASSPYPFQLDPAPQPDGHPLLTLNPAPLWRSLLCDLHQSTDPALIAARFHLGLVKAIAHLIHHLHQTYSFTHIALTGGVFQNRILTEQLMQHLAICQPELTTLVHHYVPPNDGGLSLGQAVVAIARQGVRSEE